MKSRTMSLYGTCGGRKYLSPQERTLFSDNAKKCDPSTKTFCLLLLWTGVRISEALDLRWSNIDLDQKVVTVECLKKRRKGVFRHIPISDELARELHLHLSTNSEYLLDHRIWRWSRRTASRRIKSVMTSAGISGIRACPKGIRHSFAVYSIIKGIPLIMLKKWMGHSSLETTEIYLNIVGPEEREVAQRLWLA